MDGKQCCLSKYHALIDFFIFLVNMCVCARAHACAQSILPNWVRIFEDNLHIGPWSKALD